MKNDILDTANYIIYIMFMDFMMGVIDVAGEDNPSEAPGLNLEFNRSFCVVLAFDLFVLF